MTKLPFERPVIKKLNVGAPNKFGLTSVSNPITHLEGIPVQELVDQYGSPLFVISERQIRETMAEAKRSFSTRYPKVQFAWSYKTNYLNAVCRVFHDEGSWAEVVSGFEFEKALSNGVPGNQIIFNGPDKSDAELKKAIDLGSYIHVDHFDELYSIFEIARNSSRKPKLAIRVNLDCGIFPMWDRFGFNFENGEAWDALNRIMLNPQVELAGIHTHIGTYVMSVNAYAIAATKLSELAMAVYKKFRYHIQYLDLGGGFASKNTLKGAFLPGTDTFPGFDEYAQAITSAIIYSGIDPDHLPVLILETGRALIDDAASLIGTVQAIKRLADGRRSTIMDFGVNILFTSFWYDLIITPAQPFTHYTEDTAVFGPLCMNIDVLRENVSLPLLRKNDRVVVSRVGAYNMTQWLQFIHMRPNVIMIDPEGKAHLIRRKENLETIVSQEEVPQYLLK
jgi:diaminopimelate decarboxylase